MWSHRLSFVQYADKIHLCQPSMRIHHSERCSWVDWIGYSFILLRKTDENAWRNAHLDKIRERSMFVQRNLQRVPAVECNAEIGDREKSEEDKQSHSGWRYENWISDTVEENISKKVATILLLSKRSDPLRKVRVQRKRSDCSCAPCARALLSAWARKRITILTNLLPVFHAEWKWIYLS